MNTTECKKNLEMYLAKGKSVPIDGVCEDLGIFDWWKYMLTKSDMESMLSFIRLADKLGYTEDVCFKVGVSGCANGMWATRPEKKETLYKSFVPGYVVYDVVLEDGRTLLSEKAGKELYTQRELKEALKEVE